MVDHNQDETKAQDTNLELSYFVGNRRFEIGNELHLNRGYVFGKERISYCTVGRHAISKQES